MRKLIYIIIIGFLSCNLNAYVNHSHKGIWNSVFPNLKKIDPCKHSYPDSEKIYIGINDITSDNHCFQVHQGQNIWLQTELIHCDNKGFYYVESEAFKTKDFSFLKLWRCPFCYNFYILGKSCDNSFCASYYDYSGFIK